MRSSEARPVNLGNPIEHTVGEIAELLIELSGGEGGITYGPLPEDDPRQRCPDITRARETLCWEPCVSACEGLKKTLDWFAGRSSRPEASPAGRLGALPADYSIRIWRCAGGDFRSRRPEGRLPFE